jgi:site-specific DNA-methyltransferase (adenine-specific)
MTAPYYQDEFVTLYHGDCLEIDAWQSADVLVTDPPYGVSYQSNKSKHGPSKLIDNDSDVVARESVLDVWGDKAAIVFGTWKVQRPERVKNLLVWDKGAAPGMGDLTMPWGHSHEEIYVFGRGFVGKRQSNVLHFDTLPASANYRPEHPTPKPIGLMEDLIEKCPSPWVIADPFSGSGATLVAARNLARFVVGVEIDEQYCEMIAKRLSQDVFHFDV